MINHRSGVEIFRKEAKQIGSYYKGLTYAEKSSIPLITGNLDLIDEVGNPVDSYSIEVYCSEKYPYGFPLVFEVGGKLPINIDWHVFEQDGHCCIKAIPEEILLCSKGINLIHFIEKELKPYFFNQTFRRLNGYYVKERPHGIMASIEYFGEALMTKDIKLIIKMLDFISTRVEYKSTKKCICGSNRKYKKCHRRVFRNISLISNVVLNDLLTKIKAYSNLLSN